MSTFRAISYSVYTTIWIYPNRDIYSVMKFNRWIYWGKLIFITKYVYDHIYTLTNVPLSGCVII